MATRTRTRAHSPTRLVEDRYYRVREVSELTRLHERTIRQAVADGRLTVIRMGTSVLIDPDSLRRYLRDGQAR
jgi:excisionase family DNA binding protein